MVLCVRVPAPTEGLGGADFVGGVLQMVSEPTLVVAHTGQCADIGRMARVSLRWNTRHGVWVGTGRVSWTDEDVGFFEWGECHTRPNLDGP
jgi:hypothetical protein